MKILVNTTSLKTEMIISQNKIEKLQSVKVCTSSLSTGGRGGGGVPPTKFSKRGGD